MIRTAVTLGVFVALAQVAAPSGDAKNGRKLFVADGCYQCHGYEGQGATPTGPRLGPRPIAFAQFSKYVRNPTGQMPPYTQKVLSDQQAADLWAYIKSMPESPPASAIPLLSQIINQSTPK